MARPRHRRCETCGQVTARYSHAQQAGAITLHVWTTDPTRGEVRVARSPGCEPDPYCREHAPVTAAAS